MRDIYLYAHGGSGNHGCEAIVRTTVNIVEKAFPGSEFGLCSYSPNEDIVLSDIPRLTVKGVEAQPLSLLEKCINIFNVKVRGNYSYYYKAAYSDVADFAKNYDLCLIIGGDTFCYGNNELCRSLTTRFKAMGKKVVRTTRVIFGAISKPIHRTSRGAIAIVGIVWLMTSMG